MGSSQTEWNALYTEGMKKVMWEHIAIQKERKRRDAMVALAIEEVFAAEEESPVDEHISVEGEMLIEEETSVEGEEPVDEE
jgi:hypothetical protein